MSVQVEVSVQECFNAPLRVESNVEAVSEETWQTWFRQWLQSLQGDLPAAETYELSLRLTDDDQIQALNAQYRQQDRPTDVLAFAALEAHCPHPEAIPLYLGDLAISVETAARQAQHQGHSLTTELGWLATHGLLHLLGWDHPDDNSLKQMLHQQEQLLEAIGLVSKVRSI